MSIHEDPRASTILLSLEARYAYQRVEELKTIEGGAVSYAPPTTPEPSTNSQTGRGGGGIHTSGRWTGNQGQHDIGW